MSNWMPWSDSLEREWQEWLSERPPVVQDLAKRFPPYKLYRLKGGGKRVYPRSYNEDGTLRVTVSARFNLVLFERNVFGVEPEDLTECDLPAAGEMLGALATEPGEVDALIDEVDVLIDEIKAKEAS